MKGRVNIMEVKINIEDLKKLWEEKATAAMYRGELKKIAEAFAANKHDKIKEVLDSLYLGV